MLNEEKSESSPHQTPPSRSFTPWVDQEKHIRSCLAPAAVRGALPWDSDQGKSSPIYQVKPFTLSFLPRGNFGSNASSVPSVLGAIAEFII